MATIGSALTAPEAGWRRYDDNDSRFIYTGNWVAYSNTPAYNGIAHYITNTDNGTINFKFYGSKLRIISALYATYSDKISIIIDGNTEYFSVVGNTVLQALVYEKLNLSNSIHNVTITKINNGSYKNDFWFDAIDIDSTGYLVHPILNQVQDINSMQIGDCIPCRYTVSTSGSAGYFSELGICIKDEIPLANTTTPDGLFYFIKVKKGILIADRNIQTSISWDTLNTAKFIGGIRIDLTNQNYIIENGHYGTRNLAFDNTVGKYGTTCWESSTGDGKGWVGQNFPSSTRIIGYSLNASTDFAYGPKTWTFEASNNGTDWTVLHTVTGENAWSLGLKRYYYFSNNNFYTYYRINITDSYNTTGYVIIGEIEMFSSIICRSLNGGYSYIDSIGNSSTTDYSLGAWPPSNEWDTYIANSTLNGNIIAGDNNIWHWNTALTLCRDTNYSGNTYRSTRGLTLTTRISPSLSNTVNASYGFRPVLNYVESDIVNEVIY
jgi:hypothetical protein